ncbi:MAG TPA: hypothetical protein DDW29_17155 [Gammaproteobacteria bacterium]|nr:hypothetical protein [Gammaproteobacteria bacterium]|tara:strand:- start:29601 stop:33488 length:3888 start_codon:yes stop_codon:yes gene_type:complete
MKTKKSSLFFKLGILLALLVSLYVSFLRQGLAVLPDLEHQLAVRASQITGAQIELEGTRGYLEGFKPHISIQSIEIKMPSGQLLGRAQDLRLSVNFWESLKAKTLVFDQIYLASGDIYAPKKSYVLQNGEKNNFDFKRWNRWLSFVFQQDDVWIRNLNLYADGVNLHLVDLIQQHITPNSKRTRTPRSPFDQVGLEADLTFDVKGILTQGRLQAFIGDSDDPFYRGRLNIKLKQFDQSLLQMPFLQDSVESKLIQRFMTLTQGEFWASWQDFEFDRIQLETTLDQGFNESLHLALGASKKHSWLLTGYIQQGLSRASFKAHTPLLTSLKDYDLYASEIPLSFIAQLNKKLINPAADFNVHGAVQDLQLKNGQLSFNIDNARFQKDNFAVGALSAHVATDFSRGIVALSPQTLSLHWPKVFPETLTEIQLGENRLYWKKEETQLQIKSPYFNFSHHDAKAALNWSLVLPKKTGRAEEIPSLSLLGEISASTTDQYQRYLPQFLPDGFLKWMNQAIVSGHLNHGRFLFDGAIKKLSRDVMDGFAGPDFMTDKQKADINDDWAYHTPPPSLQMNFIGTDLDFQFSQDWPLVTSADVDVLVAQRRVAFDILNGKSLGLDAHGRGEVVFFQKPLLDLDLNITGQFKQGIRYLLQSPAGPKIQPVMPIVDVQAGTIDSHLALSLDFDQQPLKPKIQVATRVSNGKAYINPIKLPLNNIQGQTIFSLEEGLSGQDIQARILDEIIDISIERKGNQTHVNWDGAVNARALEDWMQWPLFQTIDGRTRVKGRLALPWYGDPVTVEMNSNLEGFVLHWPDEFGKKSQEQRHWRMAAALGKDPVFDLFDENHYRARWTMQEGAIKGFELTLGDTYATGTQVNTGRVYPEFRLKADLASVDIQKWTDFSNRLRSKQSQSSETTRINNAQEQQANAFQFVPQSAQIQVGRMAWGIHDFGQVKLSMNEEPGGWRIQWDGPQVAGKGFVVKAREVSPTQKQAPWRFELDRLDLPETLIRTPDEDSPFNREDMTSKNSDESLNMSGVLGEDSWPALFVELLDVRLEGQYIGRAQIEGEPIIGGYSWKNLYGQIAGIHFRGDGYALTDGAEFDFEFKGGRLDQVFEIAGMESKPLETSTIDGAIALRWPFKSRSLEGISTQGHVAIDDGVISGVNGVSPLRWLSLLNAEQFARRLQLDFSGLTQSGLVFDSLKIDWTSTGALVRNSEMRLKSPSVDLKTQGWINLKDKTLYQTCVAIIPVMDHLLIPAAAAGGLPAAATAYVIDKALGDQLDALTELKWTVKGPLSNPKVER